jgi:hypothetical protein
MCQGDGVSDPVLGIIRGAEDSPSMQQMGAGDPAALAQAFKNLPVTLFSFAATCLGVPEAKM